PLPISPHAPRAPRAAPASSSVSPRCPRPCTPRARSAAVPSASGRPCRCHPPGSRGGRPRPPRSAASRPSSAASSSRLPFVALSSDPALEQLRQRLAGVGHVVTRLRPFRRRGQERAQVLDRLILVSLAKEQEREAVVRADRIRVLRQNAAVRLDRLVR